MKSEKVKSEQRSNFKKYIIDSLKKSKKIDKKINFVLPGSNLAEQVVKMAGDATPDIRHR